LLIAISCQHDNSKNKYFGERQKTTTTKATTTRVGNNVFHVLTIVKTLEIHWRAIADYRAGLPLE
jgi:hypothetical protein